MKKLSLIIALVLCITIGGVYATWTYTQSTDVADITPTLGISMTEATFAGTLGTYAVDTSALTMAVDPKPGSTHVTSLQMAGSITIKFTPQTYAEVDVKENGVPTTFQFSLSNDNWTFDDGHGAGARKIITIKHPDEKHNVVWSEPDANGVLSCTISAAVLADHFELTEFTLDTKALYDQFSTALSNGQIRVTISDGAHA
jgi:hypothetical protein